VGNVEKNVLKVGVYITDFREIENYR